MVRKPFSALALLVCIILTSCWANVMELTSSNFDSTVLQSDGIWAVAFIAPWCGHCKRLHPDWEKAAESLGGVVNIGRVNCDDERDLATRFGVQGFPTIKIFGAGKDNKKNPTDYNGARSSGAIVNQLMYLFNALPDPVVPLKTVDDVQALPNKDARAILVTSKATNPALWKSLALEQKGLKYAFVPEQNKQVMEKLNVDKAPSVIVIPAGKDVDEKVVYSGAMKKKDLLQFVSKYAASTGFSAEQKQEEEEQKPSAVFSAIKKQPEAEIIPEAIHVTDDAKVTELCSSQCVLGVISSDAEKDAYLKLVKPFYKHKNIKFGFVDASNEQFVQAFASSEQSSDDGIDIIVLRGSKLKYAVGKKVNESTAAYFFEKIFYGGLRFASIGKLPSLKNKDEL